MADKRYIVANLVTVFYAYTRSDEKLRKQLEKHLSLLRQQEIIAEWHDRQIVPGTDWAREINLHLSTATIILLLISPDFLASEYCYSIEMQRALARHHAGEAHVVPILLRPVDWTHAPFAMFECLPSDGRAVTSWRNRDEAFRNVTEGIRKVIEHLRGRSGSLSRLSGRFMTESLAATLNIEVGTSIAKAILKFWLKDLDIVVGVTSTFVDLLKSKITDRVVQRRIQRQFEVIGEKVGESLLPIFEAHSNLDEENCTAVALAVGQTLDIISDEAIVQFNLDPFHLVKYLLSKYPATNYHFNETEAVLYQRIISESCAYIVDIVSQLPTFHKATSGEILKQEDQFLRAANKVLQEVSRLRGQLNPEEKNVQEVAHFELEYRRAVLRNLDSLQLFGIDVATSNRRHRLSVAYVTLSIEQNAWGISRQRGMQATPATIHRSLEDENLGKASSPRSRQKEVPEEIVQVLGDRGEALKSRVMIIQTATRSIIGVDEALAHSQRLAIRGLAGSGKTTLLQWIAITSASRSFKGSLETWNDMLPFYIHLRSCIQSGLPAPETFPKFAATSIAGLAPKGWVHSKLAAGRALLLVDGLDEIPILQREEIWNWLKDLLETYPQAYFILTSRPHALDERWIDKEGFELAELQPMALSDIHAFIDHWHAAVAEEVTDTEEKAELPSLAKHLKEEVKQDRAKRDLATNPLLCSMLCALHKERRQNLPSDRIELYEASCQLLIERRDKERRIPLTDYPPQALTYRQKRILLEDLAYWLLKNNWSEVEISRADERLTKKLLNMYNISADIAGTDICRFFLERTSIVREPIAGRISFTHRTFQEFFAAKAALDEGDIGVLIEHAHYDQWWETIILACGLATKKACDELLRGLIERGDAEKENRYPLHMLAVACLETSIELELVVKQDIQQCLSELIPPKDIAEAKALTKAGELAVPYLAYNSLYSPSTAAACAFTLAHIGSNAALETLEEYIRDAQAEVIEELLNARHLFDMWVYAQRILLGLLDNTVALSRCLSSLEGFEHLTNLRTLDLTDCQQITDLTPLAGLTQLTQLNLTDCWKITDLTPLAGLTQLTQLNLAGCGKITDLTPLAGLTQLTQLNLAGCGKITDLTPLAGLTQLTYLDLMECSGFYSLSSLANLIQLVYLDLTRCGQIADLAPLANLAQLTQLSLADCWRITSLSPLADLTQLTSLDLARCWQVKDLSSLSNLTQLILLNLSYCDWVENLDALSNLNNLKRLDLCGTPYWLRLMKE